MFTGAAKFDIMKAVHRNPTFTEGKMDIGKNIRHLRLEREMTQEALADALSLSVQAISRYETGAAYPDIEMLPVMAGYFGVTVDELLGVNKELKEERREEYFKKYEALGGWQTDEDEENGNIKEKIALFRKAHAEFPDDWHITETLIRLLAIKTDDAEYLAEFRSFVEETAEKCPKKNVRAHVFWNYMVHEPDNAKAERFAFKWGTSNDMSVESLLWERFNPYRGGENGERTRGIHQLEKLNALVEAFYHFTTQIGCGNIVDNGLILLDFIGRISHNPDIEKPDMWAQQKIERIVRIANSMFVIKQNEDAFKLLDKAVKLIENMLALPDGTELDYGNSSFWRLAATTEKHSSETELFTGETINDYTICLNYKTPLYEAFDEELCKGLPYFNTAFVPVDLLINLEYAFISDGWPGFYMVKDEVRYRELVERLREIITVKE